MWKQHRGSELSIYSGDSEWSDEENDELWSERESDDDYDCPYKLLTMEEVLDNLTKARKQHLPAKTMRAPHRLTQVAK